MKYETRNMKQQSGITLLIAILVMAGLSLISLAVGAFAIQEIKASRAVTLTEPAIAAAESAGEASLWSIKRNTNFGIFPNVPAPIPDCNSPTPSNLANGTLVNSCKSYGEATFDLKANVDFVFYLYDAEDINGNLCMNEQYDSGLHTGCANVALINNLSFNKTAGSNNVLVTIVTLDDKAIPGFSGPQTLVNSLNIPIPDPILDSDDERLKVTLKAQTTNATVKVNAPPQGMPTFPTVNAIGCSSKTAVSNCNSASQEIYSRRINITVPQ